MRCGTGAGLAGTIEFYPEEGKYHLDGHRKCGVRFELSQVVAEIAGTGRKSKKVAVQTDRLVAELAPELPILSQIPLDEGLLPPRAPG